MNKEQAILMANHELFHEIAYRQFAHLSPLTKVAANAKLRELTDKFMLTPEVTKSQPEAKNIAEDIVINSTLMQMFPERQVVPLVTMCVDEIYNTLLQE